MYFFFQFEKRRIENTTVQKSIEDNMHDGENAISSISSYSFVSKLLISSLRYLIFSFKFIWIRPIFIGI